MTDTATFDFTTSELARSIEQLTTDAYATRRKHFTKEQDAVLLQYWNSGRNKRDIAKSIGVCYDVALQRYREITTWTE